MEDDLGLRLWLRNGFRTAGWTALHAGDLVIAHDLIHGMHIDVILADRRLSLGEDGASLRTCGLPLVLLTGSTATSPEGVAATIRKPLQSMAEVVKVVVGVLHGRDTQPTTEAIPGFPPGHPNG